MVTGLGKALNQHDIARLRHNINTCIKKEASQSWKQLNACWMLFSVFNPETFGLGTCDLSRPDCSEL